MAVMPLADLRSLCLLSGFGDALLEPSTNAQVIGMLVGIPLAFSALGALVLGLIQTIRFWRNLPLLLLLVLSIALVIVIFRTNSTLTTVTASGIYAIASITAFLVWFLKQNNRIGQKLLPGTSKHRIRYDIAYGCFAICGLSVMIMSSMVLIVAKMESIAPAFGIAIALPSQIALPAGAIGIILAIMLWRHWQLPFLALLSICFAGLWLTTNGTQAIYYIAPWIYGLVTGLFALYWMRKLRPYFE